MRKWIITVLVVLVVAILIFTVTPLNYLIRYNSYQYETSPSLNLYSPTGNENYTNITNWNNPPPGLEENGTVLLEAVHNVMNPGSANSSTFHWALNTTFCAYYNTSSNLLFTVVQVNLSSGNGYQLAPGYLNYPSLGFRNNYQYTSEVYINLPKNSSEIYYMYNPDNIVIGNSPSSWHLEYGYNGYLPAITPVYSLSEIPANPMFMTTMNMSYFSLAPVRMTMHTSGWAFNDYSYRNSMQMSNVSYIASGAFTPHNGLNFVNLTVSGVFYQPGGFLKNNYHIFQKEYILPVEVP